MEPLWPGNESYKSDVTLAHSVRIYKAFPGFNWAMIHNPNRVRSLNTPWPARSGERVSSPSVMVLDNQTAKIQVGEQVPVATTQQQSTVASDRNVINIQYRPTGVHAIG